MRKVNKVTGGKMLKRMLLLLMILSLGLVSSAFADLSDYATLGGQDSSGNYHWRVDSSGNFIPGTTNQNDIGGTSNTINDLYLGGQLYSGSAAGRTVGYEVFTTGDTLTSADSGRQLVSYLNDADGIIDFVLPAVSAGLEIKVTAGHTSYIRIDPAGTNQIMYSTCDAGDRVLSAGASADSIGLVSDGTRWYVTEMKGTWTDAS